MYSPDNETFSTPPSTPSMPEHRPVLSRRTSRPSNLHIAHTPADWNRGIVLDPQHSPEISSAKARSATPTSTPATLLNGTNTNGLSVTLDGPPNPSTPAAAPHPHHHHQQQQQQQQQQHLTPLHPPPIASPCFLHNKLQSESLMSWLNSTHPTHDPDPQDDRHPHPDGSVYSETASPYADDDDEDREREYAQSLTKQLAETAVTVREWSKKLGRTRVRSHIQSVLIVTKARDNRLIKLTRELALYLMQKRRGTDRGMIVYVDAQLKTSRRFDAAGLARDHPELFVPFPKRRSSSTSSIVNGVSATNGNGNGTSSNGSSSGESPPQPEGQLRYWTADMCSKSPHLFDFVVTLGGDGTVLFTSWLFQRIVPPVLPFALGSLGFLTNFDFADHRRVMDRAIDAGVRVNLRMRFACTVYRAIAPSRGGGKKGKGALRAIKRGDTGEILMRNVAQDGWDALESEGAAAEAAAQGRPRGKDKEIMCFATRPVECFEVLNDLVVDRGPSPYVSLLELFGDEHHLTTVQADGLCVATPTGSTAYSLSAGGSLVHPEIPAILITPLCPHTLSFRPMLLPDTMELRICVPFNSRSTAWASFDGRGRVELKQGDHIKVTASKYPFPTVCDSSQSRDWFHSISRTLKWNERERQKSFVVVEEEGPRKARKRDGATPTEKRHEEHAVRDSATPTDKRHEGTPKQVAHANGSENDHGNGSGHENDDENENDDDELDEEDEVSDDDDEEEEEKYDIDDLSSADSPSSASLSAQLSPAEAQLGKEKLAENQAHAHAQAEAEDAARRLAPALSSTAPSSGLKSGIDTPDRFAGGRPPPHPPRVSPRHVQFLTDADPDADASTPSSLSLSSSAASLSVSLSPSLSAHAHAHTHASSPLSPSASTSASSSNSSSSASLAHAYQRGERGARDDIYSPRAAHHSARVRIPRDRSRSPARELDAESVLTPTPAGARLRRGGAGSRSRSREPQRRAFAVRGHDESDSAASDSEAEP